MWLKYIKFFLGLAVIFASIQLLPVVRKSAPVISEWRAPSAIYTRVRRACYDCHSNETRWPWYSSVAPASWWVVREVNRGRAALNFSNWNPLQQKKMLPKLEAAIVNHHKNAGIYARALPSAGLTQADRALVLAWLKRQRDGSP